MRKDSKVFSELFWDHRTLVLFTLRPNFGLGAEDEKNWPKAVLEAPHQLLDTMGTQTVRPATAVKQSLQVTLEGPESPLKRRSLRKGTQRPLGAALSSWV